MSEQDKRDLMDRPMTVETLEELGEEVGLSDVEMEMGRRALEIRDRVVEEGLESPEAWELFGREKIIEAGAWVEFIGLSYVAEGDLESSDWYRSVQEVLIQVVEIADDWESEEEPADPAIV